MKCSTVDPTSHSIVGHGDFGGGREAQHVICLYFDDVFAKDKSAKIMRTLVTAHGFGKGLTVKADLYTCIGLDSKVRTAARPSVEDRSLLTPADNVEQARHALLDLDR